MINKLFNRIETYFFLVLALMLGMQFSMFSQSRDEYKIIKNYQVVVVQLVKENKERDDKITKLEADLKKTEEENQDLLGDIYNMNKAAKAKNF